MSVAEMNVYPVCHQMDDYAHELGDFVFRKSTSKNMDILWSRFYSKQDYPEFYLGAAKRLAICKCPNRGAEELYNAERCLNVREPTIGSTITVQYRTKARSFEREYVFMGWAEGPIHEWIMQSGTTLQLKQRFVDGLLPEDRRYLKIHK